VKKLLFAVAIMGCTGCGILPPTCKDAINALYGEKCSVFIGQDDFDRPGAINTWCPTEEQRASDSGCVMEFDDLLTCFMTINTKCDNCNTEFNDFNSCVYDSI
jgi:hypothetical protein